MTSAVTTNIRDLVGGRSGGLPVPVVGFLHPDCSLSAQHRFTHSLTSLIRDGGCRYMGFRHGSNVSSADLSPYPASAPRCTAESASSDDCSAAYPSDPGLKDAAVGAQPTGYKCSICEVCIIGYPACSFMSFLAAPL